MRPRVGALACALLLALVPAELIFADPLPPSTQPAMRPATYQNPLDVRVADPFIFREGDTYYLYGTEAGDGLLVWTSRDLVNWANRGHAFQRTDDTWSRRHFWAPELFKHRDKYYLHFTAMGGNERVDRKRRLVLAEGDSPLGPFREIKAPWFDGTEDRPIIDGHVFRDGDGQLYLYTVHLDDPPKHKCFEIHVQKLDAQLNPSAETTMCVAPALDWEGELVNEGPFVLRRGETYFLTWSANPYWDRNYSVGIASAKSPLGPWKKSRGGPILKPSEHVSGPGHHSFIESPDGKELFIAYHVHRDPKNGKGGRVLAIDRVRWIDENGRPTLKVHGPTHTPQPMPSASPTQ
ncbi:MAG: glycoside hydrolase family 43 protein [Planctomycetota bacterium]|nr:glycoside hydrolase family 43 protein [Planctomycetota bacterium]